MKQGGVYPVFVMHFLIVIVCVIEDAKSLCIIKYITKTQILKPNHYSQLIFSIEQFETTPDYTSNST